MVYLSSFKKLSRARQLAVLLVISLLSYTIGLPTFFTTASAAVQVSSFSATASTTNNSTASNYMIAFNMATTTNTSSTMVLQFSYTNSGVTNEFDFTSLANADVIGASGITVIPGICGAVTPNQVSVSGGISNSAGNRSITLTACGVIATGAKVISLTNNHVINPATTGSYKIALVGTSQNSGQTMVAILPQVTVTAVVDSTLTFTVAGVLSGVAVNGTTTNTLSTPIAIAYGTVTPNVIYTAAQDLTVTTNAQNGFVVTVHEDQNLLSANGADINLFKDNAATAVPTAWTAPSAILGNNVTYGHFGLTSDDADLNAAEFTSAGGNKWAGNFYSTTTRAVFSNTGPADGTSQNFGKARVGYQLQVSALQEAATDYSNHLIYVCTPTF